MNIQKQKKERCKCTVNFSVLHPSKTCALSFKIPIELVYSKICFLYTKKSRLNHPVNVWSSCQYVEQLRRLDWGRLKEIR